MGAEQRRREAVRFSGGVGRYHEQGIVGLPEIAHKGVLKPGLVQNSGQAGRVAAQLDGCGIGQDLAFTADQQAQQAQDGTGQRSGQGPHSPGGQASGRGNFCLAERAGRHCFLGGQPVS